MRHFEKVSKILNKSHRRSISFMKGVYEISGNWDFAFNKVVQLTV